MNESIITQRQTGRLLGVVQVRVGGRVYPVPVQAMDFASVESDVPGRTGRRGGFFVQGETMGIVVDDTATEQQMRSQIDEGCADAVRHLASKFLN